MAIMCIARSYFWTSTTGSNESAARQIPENITNTANIIGTAAAQRNFIIIFSIISFTFAKNKAAKRWGAKSQKKFQNFYKAFHRFSA
jgi:hypothetical protein